MKKFITACLLFATFIMGANSIVAKTSQPKKTRTFSSSHSKKSTHSAAKKNVVESQPIELENGMRIVKYTLDRPSDKNRTYGFMYSIEWPVSGPEPLTTECRKFIASIIDTKPSQTKLNKNDTSILDFLETNYKYYKKYKSAEFPTGDGDILDYQNVSISADNKKTVVNIFSDIRPSYESGVHGENHSKMFLNNGKTLDYSIMPPEKALMPLILKHLCYFQESVQDTEEYEHWGYPDEPPVIKNGNMYFDYGFWDGGYITSSVPISEIIPLASPELLEFLE